MPDGNALRVSNARVQYNCKGVNLAGYQSKHTDLRERKKNKTKRQ